MKKILCFLAKDGSFLYEKEGFRIVDSAYIPTFGGTGFVILSDGVIDLRLELDRDRLLLDVRACRRASRNSWFGLDVVRQLLTGQTGSALLDRDNVAFLRAHLAELRLRFAEGSLVATEAALRQLEKQRSKRLFG